MSILTVAFSVSTAAADSIPRKITHDDIESGLLQPAATGKFVSMKDGEHYTRLKNGSIIKYRYSDGVAVDTVFDASGHDSMERIEDYYFNDNESTILLVTGTEPIYRHSFRADYWVYDIDDARLFPLSTGGKQRDATISPDGRQAAFVRDNNLFLVDLATRHEKQITIDGLKNEVINGHTDWVYEEEFGFTRAYEWSPSSDAIAFYRFDERDVKSYSMQMFEDRLYPADFTFKYPKAGERNAFVQIKVYRLQTGRVTSMDIGPEADQYIPRIQWTSRPGELAIHRLNRRQNDYEMLFGDATGGTTRTIYREINDKYIERIDQSKVTFLPDGKKMIIKNENSGWMHLHLYDMNGKYLNPITKGEWEVTSLDAVDFRRGRIYYTSTEGSHLERNLYSITLNGTGKHRLSELEGYYYNASYGEQAKYYVATHSNAATPPVTALYRSNGKLVRMIEDNATLRHGLDELRMPVKEFFSFTNDAGVELFGYILRPQDFDPERQYPLFMTQYSGPGSQRVDNRWGASWEMSLVGEGYLVACVDGRGTGFRGEGFHKSTYGNLGGLETIDQIEAARYLGSLPYVDRERIGIYGWSFGGFTALNCILKGADVFKLAIAVAPVTSWRFYDTIYTELYNGLPQENPRGYDDNSPINFADNLRGKLFIAHGTADDNVHVQNTYEMTSRLLKANKDFEMMIYPDKNHSMGTSRRDLIGRCVRFVKENL